MGNPSSSRSISSSQYRMMEIKLDLETEDGDEIVTTINNTIHDAK